VTSIDRFLEADEVLMTVEELAAYLDVPKVTIYNWNSRDTGPLRVKIGRHVRYRRADVDAWLKKGGKRG
jgi:excisionase family DNA binding protein